MYRCDSCGAITKPGDPEHRVVVETRPKQYFGDEGEVIGRGTEIVREERRCQKCQSATTASTAGTKLSGK